MLRGIEKNFLLVWVVVLLSIAIVLSLTFSGCSSKPETDNTTEVPPVAESPGVVEQKVTCIDSDAGKDVNIRGKVTVGDMSYVDKCADPFLVEYYCEDGDVQNQNFRCDQGCEGGACI